MVDGVLLLVDAFEGCMPQTRFVLKKALELGKVPVVVINKVDRPDARPDEVVDETLELFIELGATAEQLDFPIVYASARNGMSGYELDQLEHSMKPIFDTILKAIPAPAMDDTAPLQILFSTIDYDDYVGKIGVGRIERGVAKRGQSIVLCGGEGNKVRPAKISRLYRFEGLHRVEVEEVHAGDILCMAGAEDLNVGETACDPACVEPMPFVHIDEPTVSMLFKVNDSPFAGREGRYALQGQRQPLRRARGPVRHQQEHPGAALQGGQDQRVHAGGGDRDHRHLQGQRPGRAAPVDPH